jgi:hypothetical protein
MSSRIHQLFGQALDQPEAQRLHWLRAQCGDDQPLFDAVTRLLRADAAASLLDGDVAELVEPLVTQSPDRDDRSFEERVGNQFGPCIIRQLLGRLAPLPLILVNRCKRTAEPASLYKVKGRSIAARRRSHSEVIPARENPWSA